MVKDSAKAIGEVLDQVEVVRGRSFENWRGKIGEVRAALRSIAEKAKSSNDSGLQDMAEHHARTLDSVFDEMDRAARGWVSTREELEGRTAYADLQNKIIEGWPRSAVADRLFYVGTGLLGGGGLVYAVFGPGAVWDYVALGIVGLGALIISLVFLGMYDRERAKHFRDIRNRVR